MIRPAEGPWSAYASGPWTNFKPALPADADSRMAEQDRLLGLPAGFTRAQLMVESGLRPGLVSKAGAEGFAQVMPATRRTLEQRAGRSFDPNDFDDSLAMHRMVMEENLRRFGNPDDAARAYNGGWNRARWNNPETARYVQRIRAHLPRGPWDDYRTT